MDARWESWEVWDGAEFPLPAFPAPSPLPAVVLGASEEGGMAFFFFLRMPPAWVNVSGHAPVDLKWSIAQRAALRWAAFLEEKKVVSEPKGLGRPSISRVQEKVPESDLKSWYVGAGEEVLFWNSVGYV